MHLQTAFAAESNLPEGQCMKEQLNTGKLRMFRVRTRMPAVLKAEWHCLVAVKTFIENIFFC